MKTNYSKRVVSTGRSTEIVEVSNLAQSTKRAKLINKVNHVICIDISGSMYDVLPEIRTQLKSRLVDIVNDNDTVSIVWFNNKCGFVSEMIHLSKVNDVREMNKKIDQFLKPNGCTNFLDPIKLVNSLINRMNSAKGLWSLFFMSDGGHNTGGSWGSVVDELSNLHDKVSNAVICEYGYWADSEKLNQMAEILGGQKIFNKDFNEYRLDFESVIKSSSKSTVKRMEFDLTSIKSSMRLQLMFTVDKESKSIKVYSTDKVDKILIPEDTSSIYYIQKRSSGNSLAPIDLNDYSTVYSAVYVLSERLKYDLAEEILYSTKDKELIDLFSNSFGKQRLEEFRSLLLSRVSGDTKCVELVNSSYRPNNRRYCILDLIDDLMSDESNLIHLTHPDFKYNRTTSKSVNKVILSDEDRDKLSKSSTKSDATKVLNNAAKNQVIMRVSDENAGYPISDLTWNSERANISFMVRIPVDLTVPTSDHKGTFDVKSYITRNYTIIKDGILNADEIIVTTSPSLRGKFKRMGLVTKLYNDGSFRMNISSLPIINKKRASSVYSSELGSLELNLLKYKIINKYLSHLMKKSSTIPSNYDKYLLSLGITPNGYSPRTEVEKSGDFYQAPCLVTKIEKFSSIPKIDDVLGSTPSTTAGKYTMSLINGINFLLSTSSIEDVYKTYKKSYSDTLMKISKIKFTLLVSRKWFVDKSGVDDNSLDVNINNTPLKMSFVFTEKKIDL